MLCSFLDKQIPGKYYKKSYLPWGNHQIARKMIDFQTKILSIEEEHLQVMFLVL